MRWSKKQLRIVLRKTALTWVCINSIHFSKNQSVLTMNLKTSAGPNNIIVPYKVDTGSNGNIMPLHIYKKLFPKITNEPLAATKTSN